MPGAHKIDAASWGCRIAGGKITDMRLFFSDKLRSLDSLISIFLRKHQHEQVWYIPRAFRRTYLVTDTNTHT